jgi:hypothetical protein
MVLSLLSTICRVKIRVAGLINEKRPSVILVLLFRSEAFAVSHGKPRILLIWKTLPFKLGLNGIRARSAEYAEHE